jgi:hypothetical protein
MSLTVDRCEIGYQSILDDPSKSLDDELLGYFENRLDGGENGGNGSVLAAVSETGFVCRALAFSARHFDELNDLRMFVMSFLGR